MYDWPGNVRELRNAIERALLLETTDRLQVGNLPPQLVALIPTQADLEGIEHPVLSMQEAEQQALVHALEASERNMTKAAQMLEINRTTLYRKLKRYKLLEDR